MSCVLPEGRTVRHTSHLGRRSWGWASTMLSLPLWGLLNAGEGVPQVYECIGRDVRPGEVAPILGAIHTWCALFVSRQGHGCRMLISMLLLEAVALAGVGAGTVTGSSAAQHLVQ